MPLVRELEAFRGAVRKFLRSRIGPHLDEWEKTGLPYREVFPALASRGYLGVCQPVEYGGLGLAQRYSDIAAQEFGRLTSGSIAMSVSVQSEIVMPMLTCGSEEIRNTFLRSAISGNMISAFAVSETQGGSSLRNIQLFAEPVADGYLVNGSKRWITNGSVADFVVAVCRTAHGASPTDLSIIVVPTSLRGVSQTKIPDKLGNHASDHGDIRFDDVVVPASNVLGTVGDGYSLMSDALVRERRYIAIVACAQARRIIEHVIDWACNHQVKGSALIDVSTTRLAVTEIHAQLELVEAYVERWTTNIEPPELSLRTASVMKLKATEVARRAAELSLQLHGARAYMSAAGPARDIRDMAAWSLAGGADHALVQFISEHIDRGGSESNELEHEAPLSMQ